MESLPDLCSLKGQNLQILSLCMSPQNLPLSIFHYPQSLLAFATFVIQNKYTRKTGQAENLLRF